MTFPARLTELLEKNKQGDIADGLKLSSFLFNHAEAIRDLVVAASNVSKILDHPTHSVTVLDSSKLREALAKLEEA